MNYYNDNDPFCCAWIKQLIADGLIPPGDVDNRSISDVRPDDLKGYVQCHFFAGIGGWPYALALAGWPAGRPVWTGSCPCQPLSVAGKGLGERDERHLWPIFFRLISECRPPTVFGEQVASKDGREWLAGVRADLETLEYAIGAADLCAAGVCAPHIRQRLFWVADNGGTDYQGKPQPIQRSVQKSNARGITCFWSNSIFIPCADGKWRRVPGRVGFSNGAGLQQGDKTTETARYGNPTEPAGFSNHLGFPEAQGVEPELEIEPALFPLASGLPNHVDILRGAGSAIVPQVAAIFIEAFMEAL